MRAAYAGLRIGAPVAIRGNPEVLGRKFCAGCGRWRHVIDFSTQKRQGSLYSSYCRVCTARRHRRYYHSAHSVQWWERHREYARIWSQTKRRLEGKPERQWSRARVIDQIEYRFLPAAPLAGEIALYLAHPRPGATIGDRDFGKVGLARRAGVPARSLERLITGESRRVRLDLADKLAVAMGVPLALIYGDMPATALSPNGGSRA
jgi:hypothetical protein